MTPVVLEDQRRLDLRYLRPRGEGIERQVPEVVGVAYRLLRTHGSSDPYAFGVVVGNAQKLTRPNG